MEKSIVIKKVQLPAEIDELHKFILIGKEKLKAHKAKIRAIEKVKTAHIAKDAAISEGQDVAEIVLDAECKLGEMIDSLDRSESARSSREGKSLKILPEGITYKESHYTQELSRHPIVVENIKQIARDKERLVTSQEVYREIKKLKREEEIKNTESRLALLPSDEFDVIAIDPPWPYGTEYKPNWRSASPYTEMSLEQIEKKVKKVKFAEDCVLWLWTTHRFMRHSFPLLDAWGFREVIILTWIKDRIGLGSWLRSQSEFCIMAVKGSPKVKLTNQSTVIYGRVREHSRKPNEFYEMVDSLCIGRRPFLDCFGRQKRLGWKCWGLESDKFNGLE